MKVLKILLKYVAFFILFLIIAIIITSVSYYQVSKRKFIRLLNEYQAYEQTDNNSLPDFKYASSDHKLLDSLRIKYDLDSVAEKGSEINQIINVMRWAHYKVPHSTFDAINPGKRNALNIIDVTSRENKGVNCRMVATVLNEAYLSLGFKSRMITCTPYADDYKENHSLVMVFSDSLQKWLYMDPTWEAYFMDVDSTILSPNEIRKKLGKKEPILVSDNINYNGKKQMTKSMYKMYMSKNMFRFYCSESSEPGYETKEGIKTFIHLYPKNYHPEKLSMTDTRYKVYIDKYTSNDQYFWNKP